MTASKFLSEFNLHDSVINKIGYSPDQGALKLFIDLCNYMQPMYKENEPEITPGYLEFTGVEELKSAPDLNSLAWGAGLDGEILRTNLLPSGRSHLCHVEFMATLSDYANKKKILLKFDFLTSGVEWKPCGEKGGSTARTVNPERAY